MSEDDNSAIGRTPIWFLIIIILAALPTFAFIPAVNRVMSGYMSGFEGLSGWLYPVYIVISGICAYLCYPERRTVAWILVILMTLSYMMLLAC